MPRPEPTFPLAPLEQLARIQSNLPSYQGGENDGTFNDTLFAKMIGVSSRSIARWRAAGGYIGWTAADECATALGFSPWMIWPGEWFALDAELIEDGFDEEWHPVSKAVNARLHREAKAIDAALAKVGRILAERGTSMSLDGQPAS